ncbi:MAG TPA: type I methionyl aminopeptidase [Ilumatobacter sp.]|nr:type I methionyl aminopeptidase [Ilumatobacter sp.]
MANDRCWCGSGSKHKRCHSDARALRRPAVTLGQVSPVRPVPGNIARPDYVVDGKLPAGRSLQIQSPDGLARMRHAGAVAAEVLTRACAAAAPGVTTDELDAVAHATYVELGAYPSTLGYHGFPKSICTSVNGVLCHGIPDDRPLADGDIVNIDVTAFVDGVHGDTSAMVCVGAVSPVLRDLVETTREATLRGIAAIRPGQPLQWVAEAIEPFARSRGYGVVREYGGHGIGTTFHAAPHVHHHIVRSDHVVVWPGMTFTVEPMLTTGTTRFVTAPDGWTEVMADHLPTAQFEHTVVVTESGAEVLTLTETGESPAGTLADLPAGR